MLMKQNVSNDVTKDSPILSLGVNAFPSRFIYRTALRGGFARTQFKEPIKTELDRVYCFTSHSPMRRAWN